MGNRDKRLLDMSWWTGTYGNPNLDGYVRG